MFYFLVYNDDTHKDNITTLLESVKKYGTSFQIIVFEKNNIDKEFVLKYDAILSCERGGGYWLWKSYIINETLKKLKNDDVLFYLDSKYYFIADFMNFIEECLRASDFVVWKNKPNEPTFYMKNWCKMYVIQKFKMTDTVFTHNAEDCWGGAILLKKTDSTIKYINEWFTMCCDYENITDSPSKIPNDACFTEHRHDQSLLSVIIHTYGIPLFFFEKRYLQNVRDPFYNHSLFNYFIDICNIVLVFKPWKLCLRSKQT